MTCDPEFYKHTQRIFLMLYEHGLAYQAESLVNYDPVDRTVLANEQVDANGCSWRSGAKVEKKMLKQWYLKIKDFQAALLNDLDALSKDGNWPERVIAMQKNWIGRSEGTRISFNVNDGEKDNEVEVFTTRADTLFGVQYLALSLSHPIVLKAAESDQALRDFLAQAEQLPPDSKAGYLLPHVKARNPISSVLEGQGKDIPVYVAPYVLADYGSGAVMGVPGHDVRDHAFWRTNAGDQAVRKVITVDPESRSASLMAGDESDKPSVERGFVAVDIPEFGGLSSEEAVNKLVERLQAIGHPISKTENWRLRDWLISRQRYWGTPIPIVHCGSCGAVPVPNYQLPVKLPDLPDEYFKGKTGNPLAEHPTWKKTKCPKCGLGAKRETDTMDTFMDSSWYFFRFLSPHHKGDPVDPEKVKGMPVDLYIGGVEHAILHLLYARFISKFLAKTKLWPEGNQVQGEPFKRLITQGMVHGKTYSDPHTGRFLKPEEVDLSNKAQPTIIATGEAPNVSFEKMSKSKYNGVDPGATIAKHGADVTRAHMLFQAPVADVLEWDDTKITGVERWLTRVFRLSKVSFMPPTFLDAFKAPRNIDATLLEILDMLQEQKTAKLRKKYRSGKYSHKWESEPVLLDGLKTEEKILWAKTQQTIASVTQSYSETISLNTVISDLMTLTNVIWDTPHVSNLVAHLKYYAYIHLLRMLAPVAPATAEECFENLRQITQDRIQSDRTHPLKAHPSIFDYGFPKADLEIVSKLDTTKPCVFMIEGKKKFQVSVPQVPGTIKKHQISLIANHFLENMAETEEGKEWLDKEKGKLWKISETDVASEEFPLVPEGWRVLATIDGKWLNVVRIGKRRTKEELIESTVAEAA
jgi:leucyl-tRNA synthetase